MRRPTWWCHRCANAARVLAARAPATARLRDYVLTRYRQWQPVSDGSPGAAELAQAIARLCPEQMAHFATLFTGMLQQLLSVAAEAGEIKAHDAVAAAQVLGIALSPFFPFPGNVQPMPLGEAELLRHLQWFLEVALGLKAWFGFQQNAWP